MKRVRLIGLSLMMVCGASAATAAPAAANPEFDAASYPVEWKGTATNIHAFSGGGVVIACRKATFNTNEEIGKVGLGKEATNPKKNSPQLIVHPIYSECRGTLAASSFPAEG